MVDSENDSVEDYIQFLAKNLRLIGAKVNKTDVEAMQTDESDLTSQRISLIQDLVRKEFDLYNQLKGCTRLGDLVHSICQLCHYNAELAHSMWIQLFPQMFSVLNVKQQQNLCSELTPFLSSSSHNIQKQSVHMSSMTTFVESLPSLLASSKSITTTSFFFIRPALLAYLAKNHNLWHRSILFLENLLISTSGSGHGNKQLNDELQQSQNETFASLSQLYLLLKEEDYRVGLWQLKAIHDNTKLALTYDQHGLYYQEQKLLEEMITKSIGIYLNETIGPNQVDELLEYNLWEEKWINCCKELNQWNELNEYSTNKGNDLLLNLECVWKSQPQQQTSASITTDWQSIKSILLTQKDQNIQREHQIRWSLYQGFYQVCNPDDYHHNVMLASTNNIAAAVCSPSSFVESKVERLIHMAIKEWRRLPKLLSPAQVNLLQLSQQIVELQEAFQIQNGLYQLNLQQQQPQAANMQINSSGVLQDIKSNKLYLN